MCGNIYCIQLGSSSSDAHGANTYFFPSHLLKIVDSTLFNLKKIFSHFYIILRQVRTLKNFLRKATVRFMGFPPSEPESLDLDIIRSFQLRLHVFETSFFWSLRRHAYNLRFGREKKPNRHQQRALFEQFWEISVYCKA